MGGPRPAQGPADGDREPSRGDGGEPPATIPYPPFAVLLDGTADTVSLLDLVRANVMRSPLLTSDPAHREVGQHYYPLLREAYLKRHPGAQIAIQESAGLGACLEAGDEGELELVVLRNTIRFDWSEPRLLEGQIVQLDDDAKRWLPPNERRSLRLLLLELATQVHAAMARENRAHSDGTQTSAQPTRQLAADLEEIAPEVAQARQRLDDDAQRAAQVDYAQGMAVGTAVLLAVCVLIAAVFAWQHVRAVNGVAVLAGGAGACLSVLQRMTAGSLELDYKSREGMLRLFGGVRPIVGAVFGMVTFCVIEARLISLLVLPHGAGAQLAFVAFFGFLAGFNERFFQDMLRDAGKGLGGEAPSAGESAGAQPQQQRPQQQHPQQRHAQ